METRTSLHTDIFAMNISWFHEDLELLKHSFDLTVSLVFTAVRFITLILAIVVHRAFYKLMKRLPGRAINQIIYPYMVIYQKSKSSFRAFKWSKIRRQFLYHVWDGMWFEPSCCQNSLFIIIQRVLTTPSPCITRFPLTRYPLTFNPILATGLISCHLL